MRVPLSLLSIAILGACTVQSPEISGKMLFAQNCAGCHGADATGGDTGPDLTGLALRNGGVFPRAEVLSQIDGFHRSAAEGSLMPEWGLIFSDATAQVDVGDGVMTPVSPELLAVMEYLELKQR